VTEDEAKDTTPIFPAWVVLHVPHDSTYVPTAVRPQFLLNDAELGRELVRMTDHRTLALFADSSSDAAIVRSPVSRLVVDVERFATDANEPMATRGMGAVYTLTSQLTPLRRYMRDGEREALMDAYYYPHHQRLEDAVSAALDRHGRCLVLDCHSFPSVALPYELAAPSKIRPDICIGTDDFHTSPELTAAFVSAFQAEGWTISVNDPFPGALVPSSRYRKDTRVAAVMVEVNRRLYLQEADATPLADFATTAQRIRQCCRAAQSAL
jgi:N-formylglutamate amidohydrolase